MEGRASTPIEPQSSHGLEELLSLPEHKIRPENLPIEEKLAILPLSQKTQEYLLDRNKLFPLGNEELQNPNRLAADEEDKEVGDHESGHRLVAQALGWDVTETTVVPGDGYRGVNKAIPNASRSQTQIMRDAICVAVAGYIAMESMDNAHPHHGAGSDKGKALSLARALAVYEYKGSTNEHQIIAEEESRARGILSFREINYTAHELAIKKTL